ncbi:uncharacterized protein [Ptychodera flava]|uniref:uncharacterized protein isoform X1 n=1 Tax=Ptychodera flava TaxID=63121 RepID=UPI00396A34FE
MAEVPDTEDFVLGEAEVDEDVVYTSVRHHIKELQKLRKPDCEAAVEVKPGTQSSTQLNWKMPSESEGGQSRRDYCCTNMANTAMVFTTSEDDSCYTSGTSTEGKLASDSEQEGTTPIMEDNVSDGMQSIRMSLQKHGLSPATVNIMLQSWRSGTKKQYSTYAKKWIQFCSQVRERSISGEYKNCAGLYDKSF